MRSTKLFLGLLLLASLIPLVAEAAIQFPNPFGRHRPTPRVDATVLVRDAIAAQRRVSFVGQLSSIRSGQRRAYALVERIEHRAPTETRRTYLAPQSVYGQYVISRGTMSWDIDPRKKRVVVTENGADQGVVAAYDVALLTANYRAVHTGSENIAGRRASIVDLMNRYSGERIMRLWIDDRTHVVLAKEAYHGDGSLAWRTRFDAIRFTNDIPSQLFMADLPRDYKTVKGRSYGHPSEDLTRAIAECGFTPIGPKYLPEGFSVVTADLTQIKGVKNLHLLYSDGLRTISLFENATDRAVDFGGLRPKSTTFEGHGAQYVHDGPTTLLAWHEHGLEFAIVGDLDLKDLVRIATSVVP